MLLAEFRESDKLAMLELPQDDRLRGPAKAIEATMKAEDRNTVRKACTEFLTAAADFYHVPKPAILVLASRPLRVYESGWSSELFGDYDPETKRIRVWMKTAVRKHITSPGTFLSTLVHTPQGAVHFRLGCLSPSGNLEEALKRGGGGKLF